MQLVIFKSSFYLEVHIVLWVHIIVLVGVFFI